MLSKLPEHRELLVNRLVETRNPATIEMIARFLELHQVESDFFRTLRDLGSRKAG